MPLLAGKKNIGRNIETEQRAGKPHKQAVAIALNTARSKDDVQPVAGSCLQCKMKPPKKGEHFCSSECERGWMYKHYPEDVHPVGDDYEEEGWSHRESHSHEHPRRPEDDVRGRDTEVQPVSLSAEEDRNLRLHPLNDAMHFNQADTLAYLLRIEEKHGHGTALKELDRIAKVYKLSDEKKRGVIRSIREKLSVNDKEVKPVPVNVAPMVKTIPRSKRPAQDFKRTTITAQPPPAQRYLTSVALPTREAVEQAYKPRTKKELSAAFGKDRFKVRPV